MAEQVPSLGRIVHCKLSQQDAEAINRDRLLSGATASGPARTGNKVSAGDVFPMMVTRTWGSSPESAVNGQVFLDGNDIFWATSRTVGDQPGQFNWPART